MDTLDLLKTIYAGRDGYVVITDSRGNTVWQSSEELPKPFCRKNYSEIYGSADIKNGRYSLSYGGDNYRYLLSRAEDYIIMEFSGKSDFVELFSNPVFAQQLTASDAEKRDAVFKISNSLNELYDALEKTELYAETDRLNTAGRYCYDIMRINATFFEILKLSQDNFDEGKVDIAKAIDEFEWAVSAVIRLTPIRVAAHAEPDLFVKTDFRCFNAFMLCVFKMLIRKYPDCPDFRISAKQIGNRVNISFSTEPPTADSPLKSGVLRADNLAEQSISAIAERSFIKLFCEKFEGTLMERLTENDGCVVLSLPGCTDYNLPVSLCSVRNDFREHNRYSLFNVELSELCTVNYF